MKNIMKTQMELRLLQGIVIIKNDTHFLLWGLGKKDSKFNYH